MPLAASTEFLEAFPVWNLPPVGRAAPFDPFAVIFVTFFCKKRSSVYYRSI